MPYLTTKDGIKLYYEEAGKGTPIVFVHEYAADYRSWEPQMRYFSRQYRCVTFSVRGYPPSDVPTRDEDYSQDIARDDVIAVMDHLGIENAHVVGHSMGAYTSLNVGIHYPKRCRSLTIAGCGWGSDPEAQAAQAKFAQDVADMFRKDVVSAARTYAEYPVRLAHKGKDPRGYEEFVRWMSEHSGLGHALVMLNVPAKRPTLQQLAPRLKDLTIPMLVISGDEDAWCLEGSVFLKQTVPTAGLLVLPRAGHTINSEEPDAFNRAIFELFTAADAGRWMAHRVTNL